MGERVPVSNLSTTIDGKEVLSEILSPSKEISTKLENAKKLKTTGKTRTVESPKTQKELDRQEAVDYKTPTWTDHFMDSLTSKKAQKIVSLVLSGATILTGAHAASAAAESSEIQESDVPSQSALDKYKITYATTTTETDKNVELTAEINQNITDFLNSEGEFTPEKTQAVTIFGNDRDYFGQEKLGLMSDDDSLYKIQGILLGYFENNEGIITIFGFNDTKGERFVTPISIIPSFFNRKIFNAGELLDKGIIGYGYGKEFKYRTQDECLNILSQVKGKGAVMEIAKENYWPPLNDNMSDDIKEFTAEAQNQVDLGKKLVENLYQNEGSDLQNPKKIKDKDISKITQIEKVGDNSEIDINLTPSMISLLFHLKF